MIVEETVEIPVNHRLVFELPPQIPAGRAKAVLTLSFEAPRRRDKVKSFKGAGFEDETDEKAATPLTGSLCGLLSHAVDMSPKELRAERLSKYL